MAWRIIDHDVVRLKSRGDWPDRTLFWGDAVDVEKDGKDWAATIRRRVWDKKDEKYRMVTETFTMPGRTRFRGAGVLKLRFADVGQGDAAIVETPGGKALLIDGGEEEHVARFLNEEYGAHLHERPLEFDAIVVTHGDADHFAGLTRLANRKRRGGGPMVTARRVFHNGLVKRTAAKDVEAFGRTATRRGVPYVVDLEHDITTVPPERMNDPFKAWSKALRTLEAGNGAATMLQQRLQYGDDAAFGFLADEGIDVDVLGPIVDTVGGKPALRFLREPGAGPRAKDPWSASHTVNGHSIVLKFTYGNVRMLFGADLNEESEERLLEKAEAAGVSLEAEVLKVPHHGSHEFSPALLRAIAPVVSVVSSGDESKRSEHIHPRANLVGALGKHSRPDVERPLVYVTEMVAFFDKVGRAEVVPLTKEGRGPDKRGKPEEHNNVYAKTEFGMVHVRTDGRRVLVVTRSGREDRIESYAFTVDAQHQVSFEDIRKP